MNNTISAYQAVKKYRVPRPQESNRKDIWILGGDFNALPESKEIKLLQEKFVDGNDDKKIIDNDLSGTYSNKSGTKWSLKDPNNDPIAVDYILCGLKHYSFAPDQIDYKTESQRPFHPQFDNMDFAPDHAVLFASFKI